VGTRQSVTQEQRRQLQAETNNVARAIIDEQRAAREAKTARLREARERMEAEKGIQTKSSKH